MNRPERAVPPSSDRDVDRGRGAVATGIATPASPWNLLASFLLIAIAMPAIFWLKFGYVDGYAWGVTGFLMLLAAAVHWLPRKAAELAPHSQRGPPGPQPNAWQWHAFGCGPRILENRRSARRFSKLEDPAARVPRGRFDFLGVVWLLSIPFAPFFGWIVTSVVDVDAANWRPLAAARAALCVVLPLVCVLPLVRYVRGRPAAFQCAVLLVGTAFPVLTGLGSAGDVLRGPAWEDVVIERLRDISFRTRAGTRIEKAEVLVDLADGRTLTHADALELRTGPARVLVLRGLGRIIGVE